MVSDAPPLASPTTAPPTTRMRRQIKGFGLLQIAIGSIIGSGWLFAAMNAAAVAGPAALISWLIGGVAMVVIALSHAELGGMFSVSGGSARFAHYAFGTTSGFTIAWFAWLTGAATAPAEVEAALQYSTNYIHWLTHEKGGATVLQPWGYVVAVLLLALFTVINMYAIKLLTRLNNYITWWKVGTITLTIIAIAVHFHGGNFHAAGGFAPNGGTGILKAVCGGGIIFAFTGFEQTVQVAGESKNPGRNIPLALLGSLGIVTVLYLGLQIAFIGALSPAELAKGWGDISFSGIYGPFAGLATVLGMGWLAKILYVDAFVSPLSNGMLYFTTTSRLTLGMSRNKYVPTVFERLNQGEGVPVFGVFFMFAVGVVCLLPFPSWQEIIGFITCATALMWAGAPVALGALRKQLPDMARPFRLAGAGVIAPVAFAIANLVVYWTDWEVDWKLYVAALIGFAALAVSYLSRPVTDRPSLDLRSSVWVAPWLIGLAILCYVGEFSNGNKLIWGLHHIPEGWDAVVVTLFSFAVYYLAMAVRLPAAKVEEYCATVEVVAEHEEAVLV